MSHYGVTNCTAKERDELRIELGSYCLEGGYCRKMPSNRLYCQCLPGWKNDICDIPDYLVSADLKMTVIIPLVILLVLIIIGVVTFLLVRRHRRRISQKERQRREQSGNPLVNRRGNQPIYGPSASSGSPPAPNPNPVWNCETGSKPKQGNWAC